MRTGRSSAGQSLAAERVRRDVEVLAHAGLDVDTFLEEAVTSVRRAVPFVAGCVGTMDPASRLLTGARKYEDLRGRNDQDDLFGLMEYGSDDPTAYLRLIAQGVRSVGVHDSLGDDLSRTPRMGEFHKTYTGYRDELRSVFRDDTGQVWGGMGLFRGSDDAPFGPAEIELLADLTRDFASGLRSGLLVTAGRREPSPVAGPAVLVVGPDDQIRQLSPGAEQRLAELTGGPASGSAIGIVAVLVGASRRFARGEITSPPRSRVRTPGGVWLTLHATPMRATDGSTGDVVVTIEQARPPEIVPLLVAAYGLTPRERDVTTLVLQGSGTKEISASLHLSTYTVQDHLKSIFEKADVRSRRELVSRVYVDQYAPRWNADLGPDGWYTAAPPA